MVPNTRNRASRPALLTIAVSFGATLVAVADSPADLKRLSLEELMEVNVTSPARKAEPWFQTPSALEVLTEEDIRRYGATTLQDTLRLVPGLHVARYIGNSYSISSRGFSSAVGNKMQVLMDGRSLYTPLFSGVFWEVQDTVLFDLERIEVIRGPGATVWGANAVNGVINFTSKSARDTQGVLLEGGGGNEEVGFGTVRYGARAGENTFWRVYSRYRYRDQQRLSTGGDAQDFSSHWQSGFRTDTYLQDIHQLTFQGDFYLNDFGTFNGSDADHDGANLLGRWTRTFSSTSDLQLQAYYDRTDRSVPLQYSEQRDTFDLDVQHRFQLGERNDLVWGGNYRLSMDDTGSGGTFTFEPPDNTLHLITGFLQDEITLIPDRLKLVLGTKLEHNDFTGFEWQPSARLAYTPTDRQTIWGAISRAVRTPTRLESDVQFRPAPNGSLVTLIGNPDFDSEDLIAYELGYRVKPHDRVSFDITGFYNVYDRLRTIEPSATLTGLPLTIMNEREGETWGFETTARYEPFEFWRLTAAYALIEENLSFKPGSRDPTGGTTEADDPEQLARLISSVTLPYNVEFTQVLRYVDRLKNPYVPDYLELDLRLAWHPKPGLEISINGMNLLDSAHPEFSGGSALQPEVQRSIYGKVLWTF